MEAYDPPFLSFYKKLLEDDELMKEASAKSNEAVAEECTESELPLIDLSRLNEEYCKREIAEASEEWGFFQVFNHDVSPEIMEKMRCEQEKAFKKPFREKVESQRFPEGSYRWGTPSATCLQQLAWSEAFHVPLTHASTSTMDGVTDLSKTMKEYVKSVGKLAEKIAEVLAEKLRRKPNFFKDACVPSTCYLRMSRYPACPISPRVFGLMPHTDSDFLTILHQDHIGGLQLRRNGKWLHVHPKKGTLIVIIGDLFQVWSNDVYKSVEHRVVVNKHFERFSTAYFLCPSYETKIESCGESSSYRSFSFGEFRQQVQEDVERFGQKVGLSRFSVRT